jgi:hypothetical protein
MHGHHWWQQAARWLNWNKGSSMYNRIFTVRKQVDMLYLFFFTGRQLLSFQQQFSRASMIRALAHVTSRWIDSPSFFPFSHSLILEGVHESMHGDETKMEQPPVPAPSRLPFLFLCLLIATFVLIIDPAT